MGQAGLNSWLLVDCPVGGWVGGWVIPPLTDRRPVKPWQQEGKIQTIRREDIRWPLPTSGAARAASMFIGH